MGDAKEVKQVTRYLVPADAITRTAEKDVLKPGLLTEQGRQGYE